MAQAISAIVPHKARLSKPVPRSLTALAEIASALATGDSVSAVMPGILAAVAGELNGTQATLWLRRSWEVAGDTTSAADVETRLGPQGNVANAGFVVARLVAGRQELGALSIKAGRELSPEDDLFVSAVADLLAPTLRDAEYAHHLESEVRTRTRQIDEQRLFIEKVVDSLPVGLYVIDRSYRIQAWNRKREIGLQGVSREEALGRTIFEILHRQPAEVLRKEFESVFQTGEMQQFTIESSAFGDVRAYRITKITMSIDDSGGVSHVITIGEDVTDSRQADERVAQAEKLAAIGTLAAGVMHEINNPLATISACAESLVLGLDEGTLDADRDGGDVKRSLALIQQEVQRCRGITDDLLNFSRPKPKLKAAVDLNAVIARTLELVKHHPRFQRVDLQVEAEQNLGAVWANEEQMVQVFIALLLNALDAMDEQGIIAVRTRSDENGRLVVGEVIDRGHGIRGVDRTKIFEPFYTTKYPTRGTGLGLSICYAIVTEHGGRIEVDSAVGQGSVFRILLPVRNA